MAPFDASFISDEALNASVDRAIAATKTAPTAAQCNDEEEFARFSLSSDASLQMPISYAELEEVLTAPAMRTTSYIEYLLQRLDRNGTLTAIVFIGVYAAVMHSL